MRSIGNPVKIRDRPRYCNSPLTLIVNYVTVGTVRREGVNERDKSGDLPRHTYRFVVFGIYYTKLPPLSFGTQGVSGLP